MPMPDASREYIRCTSARVYMLVSDRFMEEVGLSPRQRWILPGTWTVFATSGGDLESGIVFLEPLGFWRSTLVRLHDALTP